MAKFKKKRSGPVAGPRSPRAPARKPADDITPAPPTEDLPPAPPPAPPAAPPQPKADPPSLTDSPETKRKMDTLFWLRVGLAVVAGAAATFMFESIADYEVKRWSSILFMIIVFIASVIVAKMMRIQLASSDRKKLVTNGLGSFIFLYLFVWIATYTLVNSVGGGGINTPIT